MQTIPCRKCGEQRALDDFPWAVTGVRRRRTCWACYRARKRDERAANPQAQREALKRYRERHPMRAQAVQAAASDRWRERNPALVRQAQWTARLRRYGLTPNDYSVMLAAQEGRCLLCDTDTPGRRDHFGVDHDHQTGNVRGLLCNRCNVVLGRIGDDVEWLRRAADYIEIARTPVRRT